MENQFWWRDSLVSRVGFAGIFLAVVSVPLSSVLGQEGSVSFEKHVAPIIVEKCGKCHVSSSKGKYGIASYEALIDSGSITSGDPSGSSFIQVIDSGEMPKGGLKVTDKELSLLKQWITAGAKYDGADAKKPLIEPSSKSKKKKSGRGRLNAVEVNPQAVGEQGVAWYVTWETAVAEAKRSNRPIFFMSAAAQCSGVTGVF